MRDKEDLIAMLQQSFLQLKGLLTAHGILAFYIESCTLELHELNREDTIKRIDDIQQELPVYAVMCKRLKEMMEECGVTSLDDVYSMLWSRIERDSWNKEALSVFTTNKLSTPRSRLIWTIAKEMGLNATP